MASEYHQILTERRRGLESAIDELRTSAGGKGTSFLLGAELLLRAKELETQLVHLDEAIRQHHVLRNIQSMIREFLLEFGERKGTNSITFADFTLRVDLVVDPLRREMWLALLNDQRFARVVIEFIEKLYSIRPGSYTRKGNAIEFRPFLRRALTKGLVDALVPIPSKVVTIATYKEI